MTREDKVKVVQAVTNAELSTIVCGFEEVKITGANTKEGLGIAIHHPYDGTKTIMSAEEAVFLSANILRAVDIVNETSERLEARIDIPVPDAIRKTLRLLLHRGQSLTYETTAVMYLGNVMKLDDYDDLKGKLIEKYQETGTFVGSNLMARELREQLEEEINNGIIY